MPGVVFCNNILSLIRNRKRCEFMSILKSKYARRIVRHKHCYEAIKVKKQCLLILRTTVNNSYSVRNSTWISVYKYCSIGIAQALYIVGYFMLLDDKIIVVMIFFIVFKEFVKLSIRGNI